MVVAGGAKKLVVRRELKEGPSSAKLMVVVSDANTLAAPRVLKVARTIALPMVVAVVAAMKAALKQLGVNLADA